MKLLLIATVLGWTLGAHANTDVLIKVAPHTLENFDVQSLFAVSGGKVEKLSDQWVRIQSDKKMDLQSLQQHEAVEFVQPNYPLSLLNDYKIQDPLRRAALKKMLNRNPHLVEATKVPADNPEIPAAPAKTPGLDPLLNKQWGLVDNGVDKAWKVTKGNKDIVVAVLDTGVDYTHEDLVANMWRNTKEIPNNNIDDDNNGYVDDIVGWDFVSNDNKPYDLIVEPLEMLFGGGNPGHGTHCAGNVAATGDNGKGVAGVAPNVKIMALRFISEKGSGTTADAIKAIRYAVDNGALITSNSWGSEGSPNDPASENVALKEAIQYAQDKGTLFVAAAGNGRKGTGFNMDGDANPVIPASYDFDSIISVAAIDVRDNLGTFSNFGTKLVDIGAPGVAVFSTTVDNKYSDIVIDKFGFKATWDGTSMATPHVAGAAALYWSQHPNATWQDVKNAILSTAKKTNTLQGKVGTGGKLSVQDLIK
ncbi:MAG: S8 family peptidase [Bdellovibrionia bacterium]